MIKWGMAIFIIILLMIVVLLIGPISYNELTTDVLYYIRIPRLVTTVLIGIGLSLSGLLLQTLFQNPLAGPFVIGVNSGASLMVAIYFLCMNHISSRFLGSFGIIIAAFMGSVIYLLILLSIHIVVKSRVTILLIGLILSYFTNGIIGIIIAKGNPYDLQKYLLWSLGSVNRVEGTNLNFFIYLIIIGIAGTIFFSKQLGLIILGKQYSESMGINYQRLRIVVIIITAILTGAVTSYCGPIVFLGLLAPHIARKILQGGSFLYLTIGTMSVGVIIALMAVIIMQLLAPVILIPINSILSLLALPIIFILIGYSDVNN